MPPRRVIGIDAGGTKLLGGVVDERLAVHHRVRRTWRGEDRTQTLDTMVSAIEEVTGRRPELSTSGGTSDARFISSYCPVLEFGLVGQTMHQVDERTPVAGLVTLTAVYRKILEKYFA